MPSKKTTPKPEREVLDVELCEVIDDLCKVLGKLDKVLRHKRVWLTQPAPKKRK